MSLHSDVSVPARDRRRLERLCRYMARPALAIDRLEATADGRLAYRLKNRWRDGTTHILMERHELLERLAPLIPPPRAHQVRISRRVGSLRERPGSRGAEAHTSLPTGCVSGEAGWRSRHPHILWESREQQTARHSW